MARWTRIGDDDFAPFGKRHIVFLDTRGEYEIALDEENQKTISVAFKGETELWYIDVKESDGANFRLSGMADFYPQLMDSGYWYELDLSERAVISYWGDRVLYRRDFEKVS
ncbi:MAG: hypothetical protein AAGH90_01555 [Pseudomonadota bacterium]